ncbi:MAG TPA: ATP-binding protein [Verrucomicrobiae bacterium]|nr:ATP-binding protein [Verrucomicrobiae bacterium]
MTSIVAVPKTKRLALTAGGFLLLIFAETTLPEGQTPETLTNAADILSLPATLASAGVPVAIQGVVTAAETNWDGRFFVQDASGGVFVENRTPRQPVPGDWVEITGITRAGGYAPCITKPHWKKIGTAPLPDARPVTMDQLMSGSEDSQRVEISGVVRRAWLSGNRLGIELASGGYRLRAFLPIPPKTEPQSLVGAKVVLRGTAAAAFNAPLRHILTVTLFVPQLADFVVQEPAPANPFREPLTPLAGIAQYHYHSSPGRQVHVKGVVTYLRKGEDLFLKDATGGLQVKCQQADAVAPGEVVEAVGFPAVENFLPVLEDATVRKTSEPPVGVAPQAATVAEVLKGLHQADFITLRGRLIDRLVEGIGPTTNGAVIETSLVLQTSNFVFVAEKDTRGQNNLLASIPIGSLVEVSGICLLDSGSDGKIKSLHLLLPASRDIRILQRPSWLTPRHLLASLAVLFITLLVAVGWSLTVFKKNSVLKSLVREKEAARRELQQARDLLEERVKERTAQLKVEMTARKESELQFRAVLTERTRLAQELHDTLEQTAIGVALQLDLAADQFQRRPDSAWQHLKVARNLMRQHQRDIHHSIWGLRSRADEPFGLINAIALNSRQMANGADLRIQVEVFGQAKTLPEIVEENLLRISQEAVTNVVKHSGARTAKIELRFSPQTVVLQIQDDGQGFIPEHCPGPKDGHFGLLGIRERTERLGGQVQIASAPGAGATIRVEIPIPVSENAPLPSEAANHEERT